MNLTPEFALSAGAQLLAVGGMWAHLATSQSNDRKVNDARHTDNQSVLKEIRDDVKRINGMVQKHDVKIENLERE